MLTLNKLKEMKAGTIFAKGSFMDNELGINVWNTDKEMRWIAVRGGIHDWAVYYSPVDMDWTDEQIAKNGDKLYYLTSVSKLVNCDEESLKMCRR